MTLMVCGCAYARNEWLNAARNSFDISPATDSLTFFSNINKTWNVPQHIPQTAKPMGFSIHAKSFAVTRSPLASLSASRLVSLHIFLLVLGDARRLAPGHCLSLQLFPCLRLRSLVLSWLVSPLISPTCPAACAY